MNNDILKAEMMRLWKNTFHDSDDYVRLVFDNYFSPDLVEFEEINGEVVSALLAVPYSFSLSSLNLICDFKSAENINFDSGCSQIHKQNNKIYCIADGDLKNIDNGKSEKRIIRGLYLCGLATREDYRCKGLMEKLINRIIAKAEQMNFDFCFLIPSDDEVRNYYKKFRFFDCFFREKYSMNFCDLILEDSNIIKCKNMEYDEITECSEKSSLDKLCSDNSSCRVEYFKIGDRIFEDRLFEYFASKEKYISDFSIIHSRKDFEAVLKENEISGGGVVVAVDEYLNIQGVGFVENDDNGNTAVVKLLYADSCEIAKEILRYVLNSTSSSELIYYRSLGSRVGAKDVAVDNVTFAVEEPEDSLGGGAKCGILPYGMMRILKPSEILKFESACGFGEKFSNLVKNGVLDEKGNLSIRKDRFLGSLSCEGMYSYVNHKNYRRTSSVGEMCDKSSGVETGLPVLLGNISLMLD